MKDNPLVTTKKNYLTLSASTLVALAIFLLWVLIVYFKPELNGAISWKPFNETNIGALVSTLLFISLAAQSTLEVFISNFRRFGRNKLKFKLDRAKQTVENISDECEKIKNIASAEIDLEEYRVTTKKIVSITALLLGFCISAAGVRVLQPFVDTMVDNKIQVSFFHALDIILTSGLIAGGSEGINRLTSVYDSLTSAAARKVSDEDSSAG